MTKRRGLMHFTMRVRLVVFRASVDAPEAVSRRVLNSVGGGVLRAQQRNAFDALADVTEDRK